MRKVLNIVLLLFLYLTINSYNNGAYAESSDTYDRATEASKSVQAWFSGLRDSFNYIKSQEPSECRSAYANIFRGDKLKIMIFYGLMNGEDRYAGDVMEKAILKLLFKRPCEPGSQLLVCGFKEITGSSGPSQTMATTTVTTLTNDADIFTKEIKSYDGTVKTVEIILQNSAVDSDYKKIIGERQKDQEEKSKAITESFMESLRTADVIFYVGHSRYGDGFGFTPPKSFPSFAWFNDAIMSPVLERALSTLNSAEKKPALMGMFGCDSKIYYYDKLHEVARNTAFIVTAEESKDSWMTPALIGAINAIFGFQCESGFVQSMAQEDVEHFDINSVLETGKPGTYLKKNVTVLGLFPDYLNINY